MALSSRVEIERLEHQQYAHFPNLQRLNEQEKQNIRQKLVQQLHVRRPLVKLESHQVRPLLLNIERSLEKCKDFGIIETSNDAYEAFQRSHNQMISAKSPALSEAYSSDDGAKSHGSLQRRGEITPHHNEDSEDMPVLRPKQKRKRKNNICDTPRSNCSSVSAGSRRSTRHSYQNVQFSRDDSAERSMTVKVFVPTILQDDQQNLEISIDLAKIDLARQVLDKKIKRITNSEQARSNTLRQSLQQDPFNTTASTERDDSFSRLVSDVLVEPNSIETWQATNALENINNNIDDNYNSNLVVVPPKNGNPNKKSTKKRATAKVEKNGQPPKKRGRKLGSKNLPKTNQENNLQFGEKSDLAKYVELFSNNCDLLSNAPSTSGGTSSTMSHQIVTSTTQNYDESAQNSDSTPQTAQITYLLNGEWADGGTCQLVSSANIGNIISLGAAQMSQDDFNLNTPFEDFVNYIDSSNNDTGNNVIARVLEGNNCTLSNPNMVDAQSLMTLSNGNHIDQIRKFSSGQAMNSIAHQQKISKYGDCNQAALIANPTIAHAVRSLPPPAHSEVYASDIALDLSRTSESFTSTYASEQEMSIDKSTVIDLSLKSKNNTGHPISNNTANDKQYKGGNDALKYNSVANDQSNIVIEESDDNFISRLIESNEFNSTNVTEQDDSMLEVNESFRVALDMPLLENDENSQKSDQSDATNLIKNSANEMEKAQHKHDPISRTNAPYYQPEEALKINESFQNPDLHSLHTPMHTSYDNRTENNVDIFSDLTKSIAFNTHPQIETNIIYFDMLLSPTKISNQENYDSETSAQDAVNLVTEKTSNSINFDINEEDKNASIGLEVENPPLIAEAPEILAVDQEISQNKPDLSIHAKDEGFISFSTDKEDSVQILNETEKIVDSDDILNCSAAKVEAFNEEILSEHINNKEECEFNFEHLGIITKINDVEGQDQLEPEEQLIGSKSMQNIEEEKNQVEGQAKLESGEQIISSISIHNIETKENEVEGQDQLEEQIIGSLSMQNVEEEENSLGQIIECPIETNEGLKNEDLEMVGSPLGTTQKSDLYQNTESQPVIIGFPKINILDSNFEPGSPVEISSEEDIEYQESEVTGDSLPSSSKEYDESDEEQFEAKIIENPTLYRPAETSGTPNEMLIQDEEKFSNFIPKIILKATKKTNDGTAEYVIKRPRIVYTTDCKEPIEKTSECKKLSHVLIDKSSPKESGEIRILKDQNIDDKIASADGFQSESAEILAIASTETAENETPEVESAKVKSVEVEAVEPLENTDDTPEESDEYCAKYVIKRPRVRYISDSQEEETLREKINDVLIDKSSEKISRENMILKEQNNIHDKNSSADASRESNAGCQAESAKILAIKSTEREAESAKAKSTQAASVEVESAEENKDEINEESDYKRTSIETSTNGKSASKTIQKSDLKETNNDDETEVAQILLNLSTDEESESAEANTYVNNAYAEGVREPNADNRIASAEVNANDEITLAEVLTTIITEAIRKANTEEKTEKAKTLSKDSGSDDFLSIKSADAVIESMDALTEANTSNQTGCSKNLPKRTTSNATQLIEDEKANKTDSNEKFEMKETADQLIDTNFENDETHNENLSINILEKQIYSEDNRPNKNSSKLAENTFSENTIAMVDNSNVTEDESKNMYKDTENCTAVDMSISLTEKPVESENISKTSNTKPVEKEKNMFELEQSLEKTTDETLLLKYCGISNVESDKANNLTLNLSKCLAEKPLNVCGLETENSFGAKAEPLTKLQKESSTKIVYTSKRKISESSSDSSNPFDLMEIINKKGIEGVICNSTTKRGKLKNPMPKLQIISIVAKDSFESANEDDEEFIRRTLKLSTKKEENNTIHETTCNGSTNKDAAVTDSSEPNYQQSKDNKITTQVPTNSEVKIEANRDNKSLSIIAFKKEPDSIDLTLSSSNDSIELNHSHRESMHAMHAFDLSFKAALKNITDNNSIPHSKDNNPKYSDKQSEEKIIFTTSSDSSFENDMEKNDFMERLNLIDQEKMESLENHTSDVQNIDYKNKLDDSFESSTSLFSLSMIKEETPAEGPLDQENVKRQADETKELKTSNMLLSNLSVLEMESKLEETYLDFENQLDDDALSLATSCFDSPDDDRFSNSAIADETKKNIKTSDHENKLDINEEKTDDKHSVKVQAISNIVRPKIVGLPQSSDTKSAEFSSVLKKFKIPKVFENSTDSKVNKTYLSEQQVDITQPSPAFMSFGSNKAQDTASGAKRIVLEKLTHTVPNVCAVPPFPLQQAPQPLMSLTFPNLFTTQKNPDLFTMPSTSVNPMNLAFEIMRDQKIGNELFPREILNPPPPASIELINMMSRGQYAGRGGEAINSGTSELDIAKIFGITCLGFLVDNCNILISPQHVHQMRDPGLVRVTLEALHKHELQKAYRFMFNHTKLFCCYFYTFCCIYVSQNNRTKLMNMVYDCEKHAGCVIFLRTIFYSLVECGLNKVNACRQILSRSRDMTPTTIDILVGIIFETDWGMFYDYLERYSQVPNYRFRINVLNEMAPRVLRTKDSRLSAVMFKCLMAINPNDLGLIQRSPDLMQLLELMKEGKVC